MAVDEQDLALYVREGDYDRFLAIQLAPPAKRASLYAVTALSVELARIAESVREPLTGHIRLAWWREALEEIMGGKAPRNHPVLLALASMHADHAAIFPLLLNMIEGRAADLDPELLREETDWRLYLEATAGALHYAWALLLDPAEAEKRESDIVAQARGYAMVGLARALPHLAQKNATRLPDARQCAAASVAFAPSSELIDLVQQLLRDAAPLLAEGKMSRVLGPLRGLSALSRGATKALRHAGYNPHQVKNMRISAVLRIIQMKFFLC